MLPENPVSRNNYHTTSMSAKKCDSAASPKRKNSKKAVSSEKPVSASKPGENTKKPRKPRSPRSAATVAEHPSNSREERGDATVKRVKFFLARAGVAFGPYTEFQVLESVRLGIFESDDLALAEDGKEWLEISRMLPIDGAPRQQPPATSPAAEDGDAWLEVSELLPLIKAPLGQHQPDKPRFKPLTEQQLREHEMLFATSPITAFVAELVRGRFAFATIPVVVMILGLLTSAAVFKHHEPSTLAQAHSRPAQQPPSVQAPTKTGPSLTKVSLSAHYVPPTGVLTTATSEQLTASTQIPDAVIEQQTRGRQAP